MDTEKMLLGPVQSELDLTRFLRPAQSGGMIHVIATIETVAGQRENFLAEFHRLMPLVHAEAGCLEYGPAVDLPTAIPAQSPVREDTVVVVEKWADLPALEAHLRAPHMADYRQRVKDQVKSVRLQVLRPA